MAKIDEMISLFCDKWRHGYATSNKGIFTGSGGVFNQFFGSECEYTLESPEMREEMRADLEAIIKTAIKEYIKEKDLVRFEIEPGSLSDWTPDY